jgi:hypothetical protein
MIKRFWLRLLWALALGVLAQQASAQVQYEVSVDGGRVTVNQVSKGSLADGGVWTLVTPGYRFARMGVAITGPQGTQLCAAASSRDSVSCRVKGYDSSQRYSFKVNLELVDTSLAAPVPAPDVWLQNE